MKDDVVRCLDYFNWSGNAQSPPTAILNIDLQDLRQEALFEILGTKSIQLLNDYGDVKRKGEKKCKKRNPARQVFRSMTLTP